MNSFCRNFTLLIAAAGTLPAQTISSFFFAQDTRYSTDMPSVPYSGLRLWDTNTRWFDLEATNGSFTWTTLDSFLAAANTAGADVMLTLGATPAWASSNPTDSQCIVANGACDPPSDIGSGDNMWKAYITAVVNHSLTQKAAGNGYIKYYELWNEPGNWFAYWAGTPAQMATMAQDAYAIIHSLDPNALVVSPCPNHDAANAFLSAYFAAGGSNAQDIVAFHGYNFTQSYGMDPEVSGLMTWVINLKSLLQSYGKSSTPIWATEGDWGNTTSLTAAQEAAWVVKYHLLLLSAGIQRSYWYQWDSARTTGQCAAVWGKMWDQANGICPAGTVFQWLQGYLVGGAMTTNPFCSNAGDDTWSCLLSLPNGHNAQFVWNTNATTPKTISLDTRFNGCTNIDGTTCTIASHTASIGPSPVLLTMN